jgi:hypothetical protein
MHVVEPPGHSLARGDDRARLCQRLVHP